MDADKTAALLREAMRARRRTEQAPGVIPLDQADRIRDRIAALHLAEGDEVIGYKIGLSDPASQRAFGIDTPQWGRLFATQLIPSGAGFASGGLDLLLEVELLTLLDTTGSGLSGGAISPQAVYDSIRSVAPSFELVSSRWAAAQDRDLGAWRADNGMATAAVAGEAQPVPPLEQLARLSGTFRLDSAAPAAVGAPVPILENLVWLLNDLRQRDAVLPARMAVLTGALHGPVALDPRCDHRIEAELDGLGSVQLHLSAAPRLRLEGEQHLS